MNNASYIPLADLMVQGRPPEQPVGLQASGWVSWQNFYGRVAQLAHVLSLRSERRWALLHADAVEFSIQLLALLHAGKQVVLPPNLQCVQHKTMGDVVDAVLGESLILQARSQSPSFNFQPLHQAEVSVYTSGSTGQPKGVRKTLEQLEQEVRLLERHFGAVVGGCGVGVFGSALPHHMYGFTFRVLWPLVSGRVMDGTLCQNPDMLVERGLVFSQGVMVASPAQLSRWPDWLSSGVPLPKPRLLLSAGGGLEPSVVEWLQQRLGVWPVEIYGSSETGVIAWKQGKHVAWTPFQGVSVEADAGGAALVCSPLLGGQAYCRIEDAVEVLPQGGFHLKGRLDRTVKIEEKRLFLPDMEVCLEQHVWVQACRLLLIPGARQVLGAAVVLSAEGKACLSDGGKWAMTQVFRRDLSLSFDRVLMPRRWRFVEHLPLTERGKIDPRALMDLFQDES